MRILLVEDNVHLLRTLTQALEASHAVVDTATDGHHADALLASEHFDVVVLDLALPNCDGLELLRRLRDRGNKVPVLILTASGDTEDRVRGLDAGADDYLAKPFELVELEARLRALHRRSLGHAHTVLQVGRLAYDSVSRSFRIGGSRIALPPREHQVLELLIGRTGQTMSKRALVERLCPLEQTLTHDALEIYVHRLRRKIAGSGAVIHTLRGLGYILEPDDAASA